MKRGDTGLPLLSAGYGLPRKALWIEESQHPERAARFEKSFVPGETQPTKYDRPRRIAA
jgi:hypothetical protein